MLGLPFRFSLATATKIHELKNSSEKETLWKAPLFGCRCQWKKWCLEKRIAKEIENYEPAELNTLLARFYAELRTSSYEPGNRAGSITEFCGVFIWEISARSTRMNSRNTTKMVATFRTLWTLVTLLIKLFRIPARPLIWTHRYFYKEKSGEARSRKPSQPGWPGSYEETLKNKHGEDYEPESLKVMIASLDRHLKNKGYSLSIVRDREFSSSKQVRDEKAKQLRLADRGNRPNIARQLSEVEEEILWKSEKLGGKTQNPWFHTMWCLLTEQFGLPWRQEHHRMRLEDFRIMKGDDGLEFAEFAEMPTKTRPGGLNAKPRQF